MTLNLPYLLFDIGGTNTRLCLSRDSQSLTKYISFSTPQSFQEGIDAFIASAQELLGGQTPGAIAGGIAGPLNQDKSAVTNPPNLPSWANQPLKKSLKDRFQAPVYLENDTVMAGLGEATSGAGQKYQLVVYITVSTGVNGVKIESGKISPSAFGFEIGHQIIDFDNSAIKGTSGKGELEDFISGREVKERFNQDPSVLNSPEAWDDIAQYLAIGLHNTIVYWSPEIIILGGSLIKKISLDDVENHLKHYLTIFNQSPPIVKAVLGDTAGLHGALRYLNTIS